MRAQTSTISRATSESPLPRRTTDADLVVLQRRGGFLKLSTMRRMTRQICVYHHQPERSMLYKKNTLLLPTSLLGLVGAFGAALVAEPRAFGDRLEADTGEVEPLPLAV